MNKLEARIIIEDTGNYEEEEIEEVLDVYEEVMKHVGFKDERRDKRYIVKFHDISYYMPDGVEEGYADNLFEDFCWQQSEIIEENLNENNIYLDSMLHPMCVGNYQPFILYIPEITEENAIDIAMRAYDEFNYEGGQYVKNYIYAVELLQDLEDNYMDYWIEFLEESDFPQEYLEQIKEKYNRDRERKN